MNPLAITFLASSGVCLLLLPRRWAFLSLLAGAGFITIGQVIDLGPFSFTVTRTLVAIGVLRVAFRRERLPGGIVSMDWVMIFWAIWLCLSSAFHEDPRADLIGKLGQAYEACGVYFLVRIFCTSFEDLIRLGRGMAFVLLPVAAGMLFEHLTMRNWFSIFGGVPELAIVRDGHIRAIGPFMHPILAGTVGAVTLPLMIGLSNFLRKTAILGGLACVAMIIASASSGPLMSAMASLAALSFWPLRARMRQVRWAAVLLYVLLDIVMKAPAYYVIAKIDLTGSSTGWHRAELIHSALNHINEWYLTGTDYTRHWMPTGVTWNPKHTDITNHYLHMGVEGGLPLMMLFLFLISKAFGRLGKGIRAQTRTRQRFLFWALGAVLFSHTVTFISVSYFDQSIVFFYVALAVIGSTTTVAAIDSPGAWIFLRRRGRTEPRVKIDDATGSEQQIPAPQSVC